MVDEKFQFNDDLSGHYTFQFDYSAILELDTSGSANSEMDKGYLEMESELKKIDGISDILILSDNEIGNVLVSYDFNGIEALNQANFNKESKRYNKFFSLNGRKLEFTVDFSEELEEYKDPTMDDTEILENLESMVDYTMTISFASKIKPIRMNNFTQIDDQTISYRLNKEGVLKPSYFQVKIK